MKSNTKLLLCIILVVYTICVLALNDSSMDNLMEKVDDILIEKIKDTVYKNTLDDDITDSIKNLLKNDNSDSRNKTY